MMGSYLSLIKCSFAKAFSAFDTKRHKPENAKQIKIMLANKTVNTVKKILIRKSP